MFHVRQHNTGSIELQLQKRENFELSDESITQAAQVEACTLTTREPLVKQYIQNLLSGTKSYISHETKDDAYRDKVWRNYSALKHDSNFKQVSFFWQKKRRTKRGIKPVNWEIGEAPSNNWGWQ